jgi:putative DNA primase/helicase
MSENFEDDYSDLEERYGSSGPKAPGEIIPLRPQKPGEEWKAGLRYNDKGLTKDPGNAALILANDPDWVGLRFDEFTGQETCINLPRLAGMPKPTTPEGVELYATHWLAKARHQTFSTEAVRAAISLAARQRPYHAVRDYLDGLAWDGKRRIQTWLTDYLSIPDTPTVQAIGRISAVARAYKPGSKVDHMLVIEGDQGASKTTALDALASTEWFQPELGDLRNKDSLIALKGKWIVCMDELHALRSSDVTELAKNYLTRTVDKYRPPYGRSEIVVPRSCVFSGTTNAEAYLTDPTGNRRFWPVRIPKGVQIDPEPIRRDRDQIWAEATQAYLGRERWWPTREMQTDLAELTHERTKGDEWEEHVHDFIKGRVSVSLGEVLVSMMVERKDWDQRVQNRVSAILTASGWVRRRFYINGARPWRYVPPESQ